MIAESRAGMTQVQLADAIGVHRTAITKIESGERALNLAELVAVASHLGVTPDHLLYDDRVPVFEMRSDVHSGLVEEAVAACTEVIRVHDRFRVAAGRD